MVGSPRRIGLTASNNGIQYLTVWDTAGYIIGQVTWNPDYTASAFVGLDTGDVPIGFVSYGNDDLWNGQEYTSGGDSIYSDTWTWSGPCGNDVLDPGELCDDGNVDTDYALCVYDADGVVVAGLGAPAASTCGTSDCWRVLGAAGKEKGVLFQDKSKVPTHDGIKMLLGKADDGLAGKATVKLVALGVNIPAMATSPSINGPVIAQVVTNNAACWTVEFTGSDVIKNDGVIYKAKMRPPTGGG